MISFNEDNIIIGLDVHNKEDAIKVIVDNMCETGYLEPQYYDEVIEREKKYPTGLPTEPYGVAIPHANTNYVKKAGIGIAVLKETVSFENMASLNEWLDVKIIFLIANKHSGDHISDLQKLMSICESSSTLEKLSKVKTNAEMIKVLKNI